MSSDEASASLHLENFGSYPLAFGLYLPEAWAADAAQREKAGVPEEIEFPNKPEIALAQMQAARAAGVVRGTVLADAAYGLGVMR